MVDAGGKAPDHRHIRAKRRVHNPQPKEQIATNGSLLKLLPRLLGPFVSFRCQVFLKLRRSPPLHAVGARRCAHVVDEWITIEHVSM
jgi:hypothetical protein